jgi:hypothetical protein
LIPVEIEPSGTVGDNQQDVAAILVRELKKLVVILCRPRIENGAQLDTANASPKSLQHPRRDPGEAAVARG